MDVKDLCKKYDLQVEPLDANTYKVLTESGINLDSFMEDLGVCSILINRDVKYKKVKGFSYKIGRLYAFTTLPNFNDVGISFRHELINRGISVATEQNRILPDDDIGMIGVEYCLWK